MNWQQQCLLLLKGSEETFLMVFIASFFGILLGLALGIILYLTQKNKMLAHPKLYACLSLIVNITRSIPFIIFLIAIVPFTRLIVGSSIGLGAAIVPLTLAAIPLYARIAETAFNNIAPGLIDAALSMGTNTWQLITKIFIPEALPHLIQGGALTIISLIGYSGMAGAVGGGGLGQLAIEYGYQRFEIGIMLMTVGILVLFVQFIQWTGDYLARKKNLKLLTGFCLFAGLFSIWALLPTPASQMQLLTIGIVGGPQEKIMQVAEKIAREQYDLTLKIVVFSDYVLPNQALAAGDLDANIFQHIPYLNAQKALRNYPIDWIAKTFIYPMGFYSQKITALNQLEPHSLIALPNDPSNEGRALILLQKCKLITLKKNVGLIATPLDITDNPLQLQFKTIDAAQVPRSLASIAMGAITNDYLNVAGITATQALCKEGADSPYANIIVVKAQQRDKPIFKKLIAIMHSKAIIEATTTEFPHGAALPAWRQNA